LKNVGDPAFNGANINRENIREHRMPDRSATTIVSIVVDSLEDSTVFIFFFAWLFEISRWVT